MGRRCCCGCPACTVDTRLPICCPCVCLSLCVTFTPNAWDAYEAENRPACEADDQVCRPQSVEIDWDEYEQAYIGSIAGHDLYYSFYRNDYDGKCYFYLESESLGRHEWEVKETDDQCYGREHECVECLDLTTALGVEGEPYDECSAGTLTTECVNWITPTTCNTCACLCECVCVNLSLDGIDYTGKACWDDYQNMYTGEVYGRDLYNVCRSRTVKFPIDRWGDVCDPNVPEDDPTACEPIHVLDDTDYTCEFTGEWSTDSLQGYGGSMRYTEAGTGSKKAEWTFTGLPKGRWRVSATWVAGDGRASNAPYTILDGTRMAGFVRLNQSNAPDDFTYGGTDWERLGTFTIKGDTLTVRLTDAANGAVYADAIHLEYIDDRCAIGLMISADVGEEGEVNGWIHGDWQLMTEPCELRNVNYSWRIERDPYDDEDDIVARIWCATCNDECVPLAYIPCCDAYWPTSLTLSFQWRWWGTGGYSELYDYSFTITLQYVNGFGWYSGRLVIDPPYWADPAAAWQDDSVDVRFWFSIEEPSCLGQQIIYAATGAPEMTALPSPDAQLTTPSSEPPYDTVDCDNIPTPLWPNPQATVVCCDPPLIWCPHAPWFDPLVTA